MGVVYIIHSLSLCVHVILVDVICAGQAGGSQQGVPEAEDGRERGDKLFQTTNTLHAEGDLSCMAIAL